MSFEIKPKLDEIVTRMAVDAIQQRFQPILDGLLQEYSGQAVETIKPELARRWAAGNDDAKIADPDLSTVAQAISDGKRVLMVDGTLKLTAIS